MNLATALRSDFKTAWLRAACDLVFRARDFTRAHRERKGTVQAHEELDRAARALYEVEREWRPLVGPGDLLPFWAEADGEEQKVRRLCHHAVRYIPWFYRPAFGPVTRPYEEWYRVSMLRGRAFFDAAKQLDWET